MSAPDENWGGDELPISVPSPAAEVAVMGEEGTMISSIEQAERARAGATTTASVSVPSNGASTIKLNPHHLGATRKPKIFTPHHSSRDPMPQPESEYRKGGLELSSYSFRNVNPGLNAQERYRGDGSKGDIESNIAPRFELFLLADGEKKVTEAPDTRKASISYLGIRSVRN